MPVSSSPNLPSSKHLCLDCETRYEMSDSKLMQTFQIGSRVRLRLAPVRGLSMRRAAACILSKHTVISSLI